VDALETAYLICFFVGLGFALISALLSGLFGGADGGVDAGGAHAGGADHGAGHGHHHLSPWSPLVIAMVLVSFGGIGMICRNALGLAPAVQIPVAAGGAIGVGALVSWLVGKFLYTLQVSSDVKLADLVGREAEVTIAIPPDGMGQIAYIAGGRYTSVAASADNTAIPQGSVVKISNIVGNTFYVERIP
jgi:membrane protein implicated in regulation of membrane protease activity